VPELTPPAANAFSPQVKRWSDTTASTEAVSAPAAVRSVLRHHDLAILAAVDLP